MSAFRLRGFPEANDIQSVEDVVEQPQVEEKKKRGPYKKRKDENPFDSMTPIQRLLFALKDIKGAPQEIHLQEWKDLHGKYYFSSIDGDDIYIWRTIKRTEYKGQ